MEQGTTLSSTSAFGLALMQSFSINITVSNVTNLYAWSFHLYYKSTVLNGTSIAEGPFLAAKGSTIFSYPDFTDQYNATYGYMSVYDTLTGNITGPSGSGTLATVTFMAVGSGDSVLHLNYTELLDSHRPFGNQIPHATIDGEAYVGTVDVAVSKIATPIDISQGSMADINVTVENRGGIAETFDVTLTYNGTNPIGTQTIVKLPGGQSQILQFAWNTKLVPMGEYNLTASATKALGQTDTSDLSISLLVYVGIRDLAVTRVTPSVNPAPVGCPVNFSVTVQNKGQATETCNLTLYDPSTVIGTDLTSLSSGAYKTIAFTWNTTGVYVGNYTISAYVQPLPFEMNTTNNKLTCTIRIVEDPDVMLTNVTYSKSIVGKGLSIPIQVTVENLGPLTETFNVTAYANATIIQKLQVTLASEKSTNTTFTWNTTGLAYGNYTISAYAQPPPYQTDTRHDTYKSPVPILVSIPGDANGDGVVDASDFFILERAWGTSVGQKNYDPRADFNGDGVVDALDFYILEVHWGKSVTL
jgi:hypothetical protein